MVDTIYNFYGKQILKNPDLLTAVIIFFCTQNVVIFSALFSSLLFLSLRFLMTLVKYMGFACTHILIAIFRGLR